MNNPNYTQIEESLIPRRIPFKHGNSMSAVLNGDTYRIYSYSTLIATYSFEWDTWWVDPNKYSKTTSRQQALIRRVAGISSDAVNRILI